MEIEQIFQKCKDKEYIKSNLDSLRSFFSTSPNTQALVQSLSTSNNFTALKIIEKLKIRIVPHTCLNRYTLQSVYWLWRMKVIKKEEFEGMQKKFRVMKDYEEIYEEIEHEYIKLQIRKLRRTGENVIGGISNTVTGSRLLDYFPRRNPFTVVFMLDDFIDIEKYTVDFKEFTNYVFLTDLNTFESNEVESRYFDSRDKNVCDSRDKSVSDSRDKSVSDRYTSDKYSNNQHINDLKKEKFRDIKIRLSSSTQRSFSQFNKLQEQSKIEKIMWCINRTRRSGMKYYLCSRKSLSVLMTFCYLFMNNVDLTKLVSIKNCCDGLCGGNSISVVNSSVNSSDGVSSVNSSTSNSTSTTTNSNTLEKEVRKVINVEGELLIFGREGNVRYENIGRVFDRMKELFM